LLNPLSNSIIRLRESRLSNYPIIQFFQLCSSRRLLCDTLRVSVEVYSAVLPFERNESFQLAPPEIPLGDETKSTHGSDWTVGTRAE